MMEGCSVVAKVQKLFSDENNLEEKLTIQFDGDIYHKIGDFKTGKIIDTKKYNAYNLFQENTKLKPSTVYWKNLFNLNETSFGAGHRSGVGKSMAALQKISSKARKEISSLEYISTESYKSKLSRMKKNNLTPPVLLGTFSIRLHLIVGFISHFLMKG